METQNQSILKNIKPQEKTWILKMKSSKTWPAESDHFELLEDNTFQLQVFSAFFPLESVLKILTSSWKSQREMKMDTNSAQAKKN